MNKVILMGRLVADPEVSQSGEITIARFRLAVDRRFKKDGEQNVDFISCVAFRKTAEIIERYMHKGTKVTTCGRIQTGSYTNKDGNKVYTTDVVVEEIEFAESKSSQSQNPAPPQQNDDGFMDIPSSADDEGLPFN